MSSNIPIAFVTSNFQTNPFPENTGPGSENQHPCGCLSSPKLTVGAQDSPDHVLCRREELSPCHTLTSRRATVSQRKPAGTDYIHTQRTAEIVLLTTLTWKRIYTEKSHLSVQKKQYVKLLRRDFSSRWMAASRWQHPKLPHQSAAFWATSLHRVPHSGIPVKHSDHRLYIHIYIYPWVVIISITYTYLQVTGFQGGNYFSSLADCSLHPKSPHKRQRKG